MKIYFLPYENLCLSVCAFQYLPGALILKILCVNLSSVLFFL